MALTLLSDLLEQNASSGNGITHVIGENKLKFLSYSDLHQRVLTVLGYLQGINVVRGQEMLILINNNERFIDAFWACILGGIIPVPLSTGISDNHSEKIVRVFKKLKNPIIYSSRDELSRFQDYLRKRGHTTLLEALPKRSILAEEISEAHGRGVAVNSNPDDLAFVQFSSGSTGEPKGVMLTHENLLINIQAIIEASQFNKNDFTFGWMPLTHDLGLIGFHLVPMAAGANQMLMSTELFVRRPLLWMKKCSEQRVTITCSPNFGYKHFLKYYTPESMDGLDLTNLRLVLNGAEPISAALCRTFMSGLRQYGLRETAMFPVYGLAEASLAVTFPKPEELMETLSVNRKALGLGATVEFCEHHNGLEVVKLGYPVDFCNISITDAELREVPELTIGKLRISGKNVSKGYYQDQQTTDKTIRDGWLETGDLGFIHQGALVITGRNKDVIFLNGQNLYPHDIETILDQTDELEIGKTAITGVIDPQKMSEEPAVFVAFKGTLAEFLPLTKIVKGHLSAYMGLEVDKIFPVATIPKTTSGKVQRFLLADRYHNGEFDEIEQAIKDLQIQGSQSVAVETVNQIEVTLLDICKEFISDEINTQDNLFELGTSSLVLTQIHDRIDTIWPNRLELTDYFDYPTVSALAEYLQEQVDQSV